MSLPMDTTTPMPQAPHHPMFGPLAYQRIVALGAELAVEAAKICARFELGSAHAVSRHGPGLVMLDGDEVIPFADYRTPGCRSGELAGAQVIVVQVYKHRFGIAVDRVGARIMVELGELEMPDEEFSVRFPYLGGRIWRGHEEIFLVDTERLLGPAAMRYLSPRP